MYHLTSTTDDRIRDLYDTAAELRNGRLNSSGTPWFRGLRMRLGTVLLDAGIALVSSARPATTSGLGR
jgi:hypothetical protein